MYFPRGKVLWGRSSAGRASRSQCEGREFDPPRLHQFPPPNPSTPQRSLSGLCDLHFRQERDKCHYRSGNCRKNHEESAKPPRGVRPGDHRDRGCVDRKGNDVTRAERPTPPTTAGNPTDQHVVDRDLTEYHQHECRADDDR